MRKPTPRVAISRLSSAVLVASGIMVAAQGAAQDRLEEVVVTARKQEENIQRTGMSVSALSKTEIDRSFARDLKDLASMSPSLVIDDTSQGPGGVAAIFIRGIGVADVEKNFDPAVGVVVDQVFIGANSGSILKSVDLARVEVLRGPQGTLFGRNTIGGVINVERTKPTGELGGKVRLSYGDYDTYGAEGIVNFALTDQIAVKLSGAKREQQEGYYKNVVSGDEVGEEDYQTLGANFLFSPSENMEIEYTYQWENTEQDTPPLLNTSQERHVFCFAFGYCSPSLDSTITGDRYKVASAGLFPPDPGGNVLNISTPDDLQQQDLEAEFGTDTHILEWRWDISDDYRFDAIYGHWNSSETVLTDWDGTPEMLYHTTRPANYEQDSVELRLAHSGDGPFTWVGGLYLWKSEYEIKLRSYIGFNPYGTVLDIAQFTTQETDSIAAFFEGDYAITDALTLTIGGRYTEDEKQSEQRGLVNTATDPNPATGVVEGDPDDSWDEFTPKVGLRYQITEDAMAYATYSVGYRSGGFNGRVASYAESVTPYDQETVDNYEAGVKTEWCDGILRLNAAVFYMEYDDKQEEIHLPDELSGTGQKTVVANASTAELKGVEFEMQAVPVEGLSIRGNLAYLDASYDKFSFDDGNGIQDLSYLDLRRAPEWTGDIDVTYEWQMGGNTAWARVAYHYIDQYETNFDNSPELRNDSQNLVDASINYQVGNAQFSLFGRNLTDEDTYMIGYDVAGLWSYAAARPPRTWGVELTYDFGG